MKPHSEILCVSANPAIDRRIILTSLTPSTVNRATRAHPMAGGKAAHVAFAARRLGAEVTWVAFLGGPEGDSCRAQVRSHGIHVVDIAIEGTTRTNLELYESETGAVTEILEPGPAITPEEAASFLDKFSIETKPQPIVVISGSLPRGLSPSFYIDLIAIAKSNGCRVFLDTSGDALSTSIRTGIDLAKPNRQEASTLTGMQIKNDDDALQAANLIRARGVGLAIVSLGEDGAIASTAHGAVRGKAPKVRKRSAVGSGDSFLAGWAVAELQGKNPTECMRLALACGAANCFAVSPAQIDPQRVQDLLPQVQIEVYAPSK